MFYLVASCSDKTNTPCSDDSVEDSILLEDSEHEEEGEDEDEELIYA